MNKSILVVTFLLASNSVLLFGQHRGTIDALYKEIKKLNGQLTSKDYQIESLKTTNSNLNNQILRANRGEASAKAELARKMKEMDELKLNNESQLLKVFQLEKEIEALKKVNSLTKEEREVLRKQLSELSRIRDSLEERINFLEETSHNVDTNLNPSVKQDIKEKANTSIFDESNIKGKNFVISINTGLKVDREGILFIGDFSIGKVKNNVLYGIGYKHDAFDEIDLNSIFLTTKIALVGSIESSLKFNENSFYVGGELGYGFLREKFEVIDDFNGGGINGGIGLGALIAVKTGICLDTNLSFKTQAVEEISKTNIFLKNFKNSVASKIGLIIELN